MTSSTKDSACSFLAAKSWLLWSCNTPVVQVQESSYALSPDLEPQTVRVAKSQIQAEDHAVLESAPIVSVCSHCCLRRGLGGLDLLVDYPRLLAVLWLVGR